jgi:DNA-binding NarL/FixJ family response regulator
MMRVLVAGGDLIAYTGLKTLLTTDSAGDTPKFEVMGGVFDPKNLDNQVQLHQPDIVLIELKALEPILFEFLRDQFEDIASPAFVLLADVNREGMLTLLRAGVNAVLPRSISAEELTAAIASAAQGLVTLHPSSVEILLGDHSGWGGTFSDSSVEPLTPREIEILEMLAEGISNKAIAQRLQVSEHTVKFHVSSIFSKLDVESRTEAVTLGIRLGLIML